MTTTTTTTPALIINGLVDHCPDWCTEAEPHDTYHAGEIFHAEGVDRFSRVAMRASYDAASDPEWLLELIAGHTCLLTWTQARELTATLQRLTGNI